MIKGHALYAGRRESILQCEGTRNNELEGQMARKMFTIIHMEIRIKRIASNKIRDIWHKVGQYLIKW
jgi:hypothetical protein